jgi:carbamoyl-phosphate synthase large subunit
MEHIEEAGIHSGDSSCTLPPVTLGRDVVAAVCDGVEKLARGIGVRGLINVQFAVAAGVLYVLEANPRASRTVPFVSKALGIQLARAAALVMTGSTVKQLVREGVLPERDGRSVPLASPVSVKEAVLPFKRFRTPAGDIVDSILGPEMRSTGEVMGIAPSFPEAFSKSQDAAYGGLPASGTVFVSVADRDKRSVILPILRLSQMGFDLIATEGTAETLGRYGIATSVIRKHTETDSDTEGPSIVDLIRAGAIDMVINTPRGRSARADGYEIRTATVAADKALFTTIAQLGAAVASLEFSSVVPSVKSLQDYAKDRES